ncbi:unnamed protein product [Adineta steineri]|uniref:Uncharacterized protein n=1 Tax=Adineta steineri TaxID=433720 RepID=A0A818FX56_9BILA|nr:unnamed protein product [Adineta steineri]CAF0721218.1 unnamed protein product [Adineta steineri]CAF0733049.1 unnamed protein product [Adineta steineri]CAF0741519.1 unnamed protein product [Adineta steineri]CAF0746488.1 unnamed protein product [Adineta steineri]
MTVFQSRPTRYLIQEKHLSLDNRFTITDDAGNIHYKVHSLFFAMGDKLIISDANGNELMKIRQDSLHFHLTYKLISTHSGATARQIASIKRTGPLWQHKLEIDSSNGKYILQKQGGVSSDDFTLTKDDVTIAVVARDASPMKNLYWVDIIDSKEQDHTFILAIVIVLSCAQRLPVNPISKPQVNAPKTD